MNQETIISIPGRLKSYIKQVWYMDGSKESSFENFADGCPGLIFQQADSGMFACDSARTVPRSYVFGQTVKPIVLHAPKDCVMIGVIFHPHVLHTIFGF